MDAFEAHEKGDKTRMDLSEFKNPEKRYRPSPFWSWNDHLDPEELRWQVREFADKGFGGYFMHSRVGLATPYLSPEWMNCIRTCLEEGRKANLESWLYDEDKWPSGFAGGFVPAKSDEYRARSIQIEEIKEEDLPKALDDPATLGVFHIDPSSPTRMREFKRIQRPIKVEAERRLFAFKAKAAARTNWYNGESYVDLLNPETTEEFLRITLDAYAREFTKDFGEFMPGIFTDEPNYVGGKLIPWTGAMAEYFQKMNGYDILDKLPLLYYEGEGSRKVRYDYWKTITKRFIEAFSRPYGERCAAYGIDMTGHYLYEDNLDAQIRHAGAAMPHYEYMQLPGIDHLGRNINNPLTLKQCSSVAHQFNLTRILSELFGCSGHSMTFEDQKWIGDFHLALGITFFCPHLTLYTMKGDAKRDYPPTFSYHQPYWEHYKLINDYFARASYLCSQGRFYAEILVLHSIGSAWATFSPNLQDSDAPHRKYNDALVKLQDDLLALHWDCDFGDELILSRHGRVEGKEILINESAYKVVIVPPSLTWSSETVKLLTEFLQAGGKMLFVGEIPKLVDGEDAEAVWSDLLKHPSVEQVSAERETIDDALEKKVPRSISITEGKGNEIEEILVHHRVEGTRHIYFLANKSRVKRYDAVIKFSARGEVTEWFMCDGSVRPVKAVTKRGETVVEAAFHPTGSRAYVIDTSKPPRHGGSLPKVTIEEEIMKLAAEWGFQRLHPNSLVLDFCEYSLGGGEWSKTTPIWKVRLAAWRKAGLEKYAGIQPWVLKSKNVKPSESFELHLRTIFRSEVTDKKISLVIEKAPLWKLSVNGKPVSTKVKEWHWDKEFGKMDISKHVKEGENLIDLSCTYDSDVPVEDMYLVGDFGVKKISEFEYVLTGEPKTLRNGDWVEQGYPFYAGTMRYKMSFTLREEEGGSRRRVRIRLPEAKGTLFLVKVNEKGPVPICWHPFEADATDIVKTGVNRLTIDVVGSLRNTFGPLHHKGGDLYLVGPASFVDESNWVEAYQLSPYGLINGVEIVTQQET